MKNIGFFPGDILIPKEELLSDFSVVACDQFTSEPEYWEEVERRTEDKVSACHMVFPEAYLDKVDFDRKIADINAAMDAYLKEGVFNQFPDSLIYVERTLKNGSVRKGVVGLLDLECYDYQKGSQSLIRATEGTVLERIPPRVKIRRNAPLESPHILILIDDIKKTVIEPMGADLPNLHKLYDFDLMMDGGNIKGYLLDREAYGQMAVALGKLGDKRAFNRRYKTEGREVLLYAVGDGNHSLATARECWNRLKKKLSPEEAKTHPARYALVELNNLHDPSLQFEAIHRAVFDVDADEFVKELLAFAAKKPAKSKKAVSGAETENLSLPPQQFTLVLNGKDQKVTIEAPKHTLTVGSVQAFLDGYMKKHGGKVDYIHGEDVVRRLSQQGAVGLLLPAMKKSELFKTVILEGALPRKTFSMGEACEKRYYLECRKIK